MAYKIPHCEDCGVEILNFKQRHKKLCRTCCDKRAFARATTSRLKKQDIMIGELNGNNI